MGYTHDTQMAQYIPPAMFYTGVGTWTNAAGQVSGTIAKHRAAANETAVLVIPIAIPGNTVALKGAKLNSIEVDFENLTGVVSTSLTPTLNKVTRGADGAVAVVSAVTVTYTPIQANLLLVDQVRMVVTLTTPEWVDQNAYYLLTITIISGAGGSTQDFLGAVANYTLRV